MAIRNFNIAFWYFKNGNPWSQESNIAWVKYRDIEMRIIEETYQQGKSEVFLDKYRFDLKEFIQFNRYHSSKQRPVKHQLDYKLQECLREAEQHQSDSKTEAQWMVEKLKACKTQARREVSKVCINLYTRESFLYHVLNTALRDAVYSKLDTLGPLCFLIRDHSRTCTEFIGTVHRGVELPFAIIQSYRQAIGSWRSWPSYTSTSKSRSMAEFRGNTLFIIEITNTKCCSQRAYDVSGISHFPNEEEVLLLAGVTFQVISVEQDLQQKYIIHIKL